MNNFYKKTILIFSLFFIIFILCLIIRGYPEHGNILGELCIFIFYCIGIPFIITAYHIFKKEYFSKRDLFNMLFYCIILGGIISIPYILLSSLPQLANNKDSVTFFVWGGIILFPFSIIPMALLIYALGRNLHLKLWKKNSISIVKYQKKYLIALFAYLTINLIFIFGTPPIFVIDLIANIYAHRLTKYLPNKDSLKFIKKTYHFSKKEYLLLRPYREEYQYYYEYIWGQGKDQTKKTMSFYVTIYGYPYGANDINKSKHIHF